MQLLREKVSTKKGREGREGTFPVFELRNRWRWLADEARGFHALKNRVQVSHEVGVGSLGVI